MRIPALPVILLAALFACAAVAWMLVEWEAPPAPPELLSVIERPDSGPGTNYRASAQMPRGGVFAGIVVDENDQPIPRAQVLLVAMDTGDELIGRAPASPDEFDVTQLAIIGPRTAAKGLTDAAGRFRLAADAKSAIRMLAGHHRGYVPSMISVTKPQEGLVIRLQPAGYVVGTVVEHETGQPVPGADVAIYLQQKAAAPIEGRDLRGERRGRDSALTPFAIAQRWVAEELGPEVWNIEFRGDEALHLLTDNEGVFRFGPIGDEVQLEFLITHRDYAWMQFDKTEAGYARRTIVPPGQTVERTFRLEHGHFIEGRVTDEDDRPYVDALIAVEHLSQYAQHPAYRIRSRYGKTSRDGSFRVQGLSFGPYKVTITHEAFGKEVVANTIEQDATGVQIILKTRGAIEGTVEGLQDLDGPRARHGELVLESVAANPEDGRHNRQKVSLDPTGGFVVRKIRPGTYRAWMRVADRTSMPQEIEVEGMGVARATFVLGGGGTLALQVWDVTGHAVDPASITLVRLEADGSEEALGRFVTREGRLEARGIVPGRYLADVTAAGFLSNRSEPFTVRAERTTDGGAVVLRRWGYLRIADVRWPRGADPGDVHLELKEDDGPWRRLTTLGGQEIPVRPGVVTVRASSTAGLGFEQAYEVADQASVPIEVVLAP